MVSPFALNLPSAPPFEGKELHMLPQPVFSALIVVPCPICPVLGQVPWPSHRLARPTHYASGINMLFQRQCCKP